jgi:hypothetical protein
MAAPGDCEAPHLREPYTEMARLAYSTRNWPAVYHMVEQALRISTRPDTYMQEAFCWDASDPPKIPVSSTIMR